MSIRIYAFNFKKQTSKKKTTRKAKKAKEPKELSPGYLKNYLREIDLKNCGRPGEDFSRHPHFRKQEYFSLARVKIFFPSFMNIFFIKLTNKICMRSQRCEPQ